MTVPKTVPSISEMFDVFQMKLNSEIISPQKTVLWTCSKHTYTEQNSTLSSSTAWIREVPWILWNKEGKFVLANPSASVIYFFFFF